VRRLRWIFDLAAMIVQRYGQRSHRQLDYRHPLALEIARRNVRWTKRQRAPTDLNSCTWHPVRGACTWTSAQSRGRTQPLRATYQARCV